MKVETKTRSDASVQAAVQSELEWSPDVDAASIGVSVEDGVVSLSGRVDGYAERKAAERAAFRVRGVRAVVDDMVSDAENARMTASDTDIAMAAQSALSHTTTIPATVHAEVKKRVVTLTGEVQWNFEREAARRAVEHIRGVAHVDNRITLAPRASAVDTASKIRAALVRNANVDADHIFVEVDGTRVKLTGTVTSWAERLQAEHAAWSSPNVTKVVNSIAVSAA